MALKPVIETCLNNLCDTLSLTDVTGLYHAVDNTTGWGAPNTATADALTATVAVYDADDELLETFNVLAELDNPATAEMDLGDQDWSYGDGVYKFIYTVTDSGGTRTSDTVTEFFYCNAKNCIEEEKFKIVGTCDEVKLKKIKDNVDTLEMLLYGALSAFSCGNFSQVATIVETINDFCTQLGNCDCGC